MNQDEIIRMARESGFEIGSATNAIYAPTSCEMELARFAALVAAAEREACAKLCEAELPTDPWVPCSAHKAGHYEMAEYLAESIRARGNP